MNRDSKGKFVKGHFVSLETRQKISSGNKGKIRSQEFKDAVSKVHKGKKFIEDQCNQISERQSNRILSNKTKEKISKSKTGISVHSIETRKKLSTIAKIQWKNGIRKIQSNGHNKYGFRKDIDHFVRSTWEANVARILIYEGIQYEYEPQIFDLGNLTYRPDFYIPSKQLYIEVKGYMTERAKKQIELFSKDHWLLVIDKLLYCILSKNYKYKLNNWEE